MIVSYHDCVRSKLCFPSSDVSLQGDQGQKPKIYTSKKDHSLRLWKIKTSSLSLRVFFRKLSKFIILFGHICFTRCMGSLFVCLFVRHKILEGQKGAELSRICNMIEEATAVRRTIYKSKDNKGKEKCDEVAVCVPFEI